MGGRLTPLLRRNVLNPFSPISGTLMRMWRASSGGPAGSLAWRRTGITPSCVESVGHFLIVSINRSWNFCGYCFAVSVVIANEYYLVIWGFKDLICGELNNCTCSCRLRAIPNPMTFQKHFLSNALQCETCHFPSLSWTSKQNKAHSSPGWCDFNIHVYLYSCFYSVRSFW